jgi:hypothetical protein
MSTNVSSSSSSGIGFTGALAIAFIVLKLAHVISWAWWLVLAPLWAPAGLAALVVAVMFLVAGTGLISWLRRRVPRK